MALKQKQKTGWNGDKQHKYELNTNRDMAYSLKIRKMAIFEFKLGTYIPQRGSH